MNYYIEVVFSRIVHLDHQYLYDFKKIIVLVVCLIQLGLIYLKVYTIILADIEIDIP